MMRAPSCDKTQCEGFLFRLCRSVQLCTSQRKKCFYRKKVGSRTLGSDRKGSIDPAHLCAQSSGSHRWRASSCLPGQTRKVERRTWIGRCIRCLGIQSVRELLIARRCKMKSISKGKAPTTFSYRKCIEFIGVWLHETLGRHDLCRGESLINRAKKSPNFFGLFCYLIFRKWRS